MNLSGLMATPTLREPTPQTLAGMMTLPPAYAALAVHDIKNALGSLEARLECLQQVPEKSKHRLKALLTPAGWRV